MSLDLLDAAFVRRLAARTELPTADCPVRLDCPVRPVRPDRPRPARRVAAAPAPAAPPPPAPATATPAAPPPLASSHAAPIAAAPAPADSGSPAAEDPIAARLLALAPDEWDALADHVEKARLRGRRVIAVAGARAGEGRTTLVRCLAARLRGRGREVACPQPHELAVVADGPDGRGRTHDKRIVLVDAGIWFPPGPIRRPLLQVASLGCDAAILVRRAGASGGLARQAALEALGIEVLGEVLTFSASGTADHVVDGDAAA